jgi:hypothetical protein
MVTSTAAATIAATAMPASTNRTIRVPPLTKPSALVAAAGAADAVAESRRTATRPMRSGRWMRPIFIWLRDLVSAATKTALIEQRMLRGLLS